MSCSPSVTVLLLLGDDSVLPAELFKGVLQGCGHHTAYALQTTGAGQLTQQHAEYHTRYSKVHI